MLRVRALGSHSSTEKFMVRADGDESNTIGAFVIENSSVVSSHIYASTSCIRVVQLVIIEDWIELALKEQISAMLKLLLQFARQLFVIPLKFF